MPNIAFRLDSGKSIGLGHLIRCTSLADELLKVKDVKVYFILRNKIKELVPFEFIYLNKEYITDSGSYNFPDICDELEELKAIISHYKIDWLIVDHYGAANSYFEQISPFIKRLICIDDSMKREILADVIINGNIYGLNADYGKIPLQLLGGEYTLLRSQFGEVSRRIINRHVKKVYITSGGADPLGFCFKIAKTLYKTKQEIRVIIGSDFDESYVSLIKSLKVFIHRNVNMKKCMLEADLFITSGGSTLYELAVCGTPSISFCLADDQKLVAASIWQKGISINAGSFNEYNEDKFMAAYNQVVNDFNLRKIISSNGQQLISSNGAKNVVRELFSYLQ